MVKHKVSVGMLFGLFLSLVTMVWGAGNNSFYLPVVAVPPTPTPLASDEVHVLPNHSYYRWRHGGIDQWVFVGEIRNDSDQPVDRVEISALIFDARGNFRATAHGAVYPSYLLPDTTGCFLLTTTYQQAPEVGSYLFEGPHFRLAQGPLLSLNPVGVQGSTPEPTTYRVLGGLHNTHDRSALDAQYGISLYDEDGTIVDCGGSGVDGFDVAPGAVQPFDDRFDRRDHYLDVMDHEVRATGYAGR
ncbi:MAG: hypothetical protein M3220_18925 [Chloroflexota bacterium]|nr:hypothetical protein [Chloroflexota bacterium]